ncbi:MAG: DUF1641 domain-containing protein [Prolixibacteraceae bacterium]|nr:DUF1641 domain-containing protein [Prolixibacteraceae bacterium]
MEVNAIQPQIDEINRKLDILLEGMNIQRKKTEEVEDLVSDLKIVGKDMYHSAIKELDNQNIEIDTEDLRILAVKLIRNIGNMKSVVEFMESATDLIKDAGPIVKEVVIDFSKKLHELEVKGYFEFFAEFGKIFDNIITNFKPADVTALADNIVLIVETVKNMTQPEMVRSLNNAALVLQSINPDDVKEYSLFGLMRELNKPEMKRALGFFITFLKNMTHK